MEQKLPYEPIRLFYVYLKRINLMLNNDNLQYLL